MVSYQLWKKRDLLRHFFFSKITFWKKKTLTSLVNYLTLLPSSRVTFQNKGKVLDTVQLLDITTRVPFFYVALQWLGPAYTSPGSLGASSRHLLPLDRPEAMTKYKLVIPTKGIMILVLWEKSFKSMEADYSNHLASPLVASCGEISPSPWIHCDRIMSPYQRCQFLDNQK